jgi:hypothetical protein
LRSDACRAILQLRRSAAPPGERLEIRRVFSPVLIPIAPMLNASGDPRPADAPSRLRNWLLPAAVLVLAAMLGRAALVDPIDEGRRHVMENWPGDLDVVACLAAAEVALLYVILRPWSYRRSVGRAVCAGALFLPWSVFYGGISMHGGSIIGAHVLWLLAVSVALFVTACVSTVSRCRMAASPRRTAMS